MAAPVIPGYERLTQIGKGGFSRVYRGEQAKLKRGVAIKVLNFGLNDEADRRSFERECELMGRVSTHPNIVTVHDTAFTDDGQPCIVMEHYPGGSLADLISEVRRLNAKEVLEVGVAIAAALEASHSAGVLHCDLKPQNILISEFGQPALGDFGISTFSEERTRTGGDAGAGFTLAYAAPEIVEGASPSVATDVYSLAATLYTSLAGRRPFYYPGSSGEKPTAAEQARRILLEEPSSLAGSGVPREVDQVIRAAMTKDPAARPASAAEFAQLLHEVGQQLGLGTATPRIADQGALPVRDQRADYADNPADHTEAAPAAPAASVPAPVAPAAEPFEDDGTALRELIAEATELRSRTDDTALRVDPVVTAAEPPASARRNLAPIIGVAALLAVAGLLFMVTRGGSTESAAEPTPVPTASAPRAEVLLAPPAPSDVTAQRVGAESVVLTWSNAPADDILYEVRADDRSQPMPVQQSPVLTNTIDPNDTTCFEVVAVRGNRLMPAADSPCVSARGGTYVEALPAECQGSCEISLALTGFEPDKPVAVTAINALDGGAVEVDYDQELRTDFAGEASNWRLTIDDDSPVGMYIIELRPADGDAYRAVVIVNPAAS